MTAIAALLAAIASGLTVIFSSGDVGLSVAILCLTLSLILNYIFIRKFFKMFDLFNGVKDAVTALNDRIGHDK